MKVEPFNNNTLQSIDYPVSMNSLSLLIILKSGN